MIAAALRLSRVVLVLALVTSSGTTAFAQQTLQVAADADAQSLLREAETLLANGESQRAYELLDPREEALYGNPYFEYLLGVAALVAFVGLGLLVAANVAGRTKANDDLATINRTMAR